MPDPPVTATREKPRFAEEGRGGLQRGLLRIVVRLRSSSLDTAKEKEVSSTRPASAWSRRPVRDQTGSSGSPGPQCLLICFRGGGQAVLISAGL